MKNIAPLGLALALLGSTSVPVLAQPKASHAVTQIRVFEGPS